MHHGMAALRFHIIEEIVGNIFHHYIDNTRYYYQFITNIAWCKKSTHHNVVWSFDKFHKFCKACCLFMKCTKPTSSYQNFNNHTFFVKIGKIVLYSITYHQNSYMFNSTCNMYSAFCYLVTNHIFELTRITTYIHYRQTYYMQSRS